MVNMQPNLVVPTGIRHPKALSPTALRAYDECPRRYRFQWIDKPAVDDPPSAELIFGNALHLALARLFSFDPEARSEEVAHRALKHYWVRQRGRSRAFLTEREERSWGLDALAVLSRFCRERADELAIRPLAVEDFVRATLPGGDAISGKLDRVDRIRRPDAARIDLETGEIPDDAVLEGLRVTDYKTGRCRIDEDDLGQDRGAQVYALAATRTYRQPVIEVRYLYLRENQALSWYPEPDELAALEESLDQEIDEILADQTFEARPDFHCRWCRYRQLCPAQRSSPDELDATPATVF